jgi:hypothetical protein
MGNPADFADLAKQAPDVAKDMIAILRAMSEVSHGRDGLALLIACMVVLDGAEVTGGPGAQEAVRSWHRRAAEGRRSWEVKDGEN